MVSLESSEGPRVLSGFTGGLLKGSALDFLVVPRPPDVPLLRVFGLYLVVAKM